MIGTSYEIDFLLFPSYIILLWLISVSFRLRKICVIGIALAKLIFSINGIAVSGAIFALAVPTYESTQYLRGFVYLTDLGF